MTKRNPLLPPFDPAADDPKSEEYYYRHNTLARPRKHIKGDWKSQVARAFDYPSVAVMEAHRLRVAGDRLHEASKMRVAKNKSERKSESSGGFLRIILGKLM